jgi:hypothetical protein
MGEGKEEGGRRGRGEIGKRKEEGGRRLAHKAQACEHSYCCQLSQENCKESLNKNTFPLTPLLAIMLPTILPDKKGPDEIVSGE